MADPITGRAIRWGIAGPGRIADKLALDFALLENAELTAVGSRSQGRADEFAAKHAIPRAYGSYRELIADRDIDVVYIATPHPQHHQLAIACLEAGQAVLVEKSITATVAGARDIMLTARARDLFAMEAMWTRFQPAIVAMRALIADGAIGEVLSVQADLGVAPVFDPHDRLFDKAIGGGALLDVGVYVVSFAQMMLGTPSRVTCYGRIGPTEVEIDASVLLAFDSAATATLMGSLHSPMPGSARVFGTEGWIDVRPRFHHPSRFVLNRKGAEPETRDVPFTGGGYYHELIEVNDALSAGRIESSVMPMTDTVTVMEILEDCLAQLGIEHHEASDVL